LVGFEHCQRVTGPFAFLPKQEDPRSVYGSIVVGIARKTTA